MPHGGDDGGRNSPANPTATHTRTRFGGANLGEANLDRAVIGQTVFADVDMSAVKSLETTQHGAPSTVGVDTLFWSHGKIPRDFLLGCGVPNVLIDYLPSLMRTQEPIQFYSCFISYSSKDEEFCRRLYSRLRDERLRVWFALEEMRGGRKIIDQIDSAIRIHDKLLLVLSETSMASDWVRTEVRYARQQEVQRDKRMLFPIRLAPYNAIRDWTAPDTETGTDLAAEVREYYIPDFSN